MQGLLGDLCPNPSFALVRDSHRVASGFLIDLMHAVCRRAGRICRFIVDDSSHCWRTDGNHELPGEGQSAMIIFTLSMQRLT